MAYAIFDLLKRIMLSIRMLMRWGSLGETKEGNSVKIDVEHAGQARMICVVLKLNIDKYQYDETQLLTEATFD